MVSHRVCAAAPHLQRSGMAGSQAGGDESGGNSDDCGGEASSECCASDTTAGKSCCHAAPCGWSTGSATCRGQISCVAQCLQRARGRHFNAIWQQYLWLRWRSCYMQLRCIMLPGAPRMMIQTEHEALLTGCTMRNEQCQRCRSGLQQASPES